MEREGGERLTGGEGKTMGAVFPCFPAEPREDHLNGSSARPQAGSPRSVEICQTQLFSPALEPYRAPPAGKSSLEVSWAFETALFFKTVSRLGDATGPYYRSPLGEQFSGRQFNWV